jgi:hypothetical protein
LEPDSVLEEPIQGIAGHDFRERRVVQSTAEGVALLELAEVFECLQVLLLVDGLIEGHPPRQNASLANLLGEQACLSVTGHKAALGIDHASRAAQEAAVVRVIDGGWLRDESGHWRAGWARRVVGRTGLAIGRSRAQTQGCQDNDSTALDDGVHAHVLQKSCDPG